MTFIDPRGKVFAHLGRVVDWQRGGTPAPVTVEWDLSNRCSLGCQSCHFAHTHSRGPWTSRTRALPMAFESTGDLAAADLVERTIAEIGRSGVRGVVWSGGGEPTLHPRWPWFVELAAGHGLRQGMYTLGGHLTKASAAHLSWFADWVVVSLDAANGDDYAAEKGVASAHWDDAIHGIGYLVDARIGSENAVVGVSFLLHAGNWQRATAMLALTRSIGATYATFRPTIDTRPDAPGVPTVDRAWITDALPTLRYLSVQPDVEIDTERFVAYRDWTSHGYAECKGVRLNATITPDGRVWLCPQRRGVGGSCLGDLRLESFASLWARHPGHYTVDDGCRVACRLHPINETLAAMDASRSHEAFV